MTQDEIIEMARQVGFYGHSENFFDCTRKQIEAFAKLVAAKEREVCAKVCEEYDESWYAHRKGAAQCAASIRARGEA